MPAESMLLKAILDFDTRRAVTNMGKAAVGFRRVESNANRVRGGMAKMGGAVGRTALAFAPLTIGMGLAVRHANEFERGVAEVATIADEAEFPLRKIEQTTLDLAKTFGTVPVEQTKSLYQTISAGATDAAEATELLTTANMLAVGGVSDTTTSIDVLTTALNAYSSQGLEAADASDTMFTAVKLGKTTVDELGASIGQVIPTAAQLGIEFSDLNAAVAAITTQGIVTAQATTGLNAALANVIKPSEDARKAAKDLGIDFSSTALKSQGLVEFMGQIVDKAGGDEVALSKLFGSIRGVRAIMALTNEGGAKFTSILEGMEERSGATEKAFKKMAGTADFQMRKLKALGVIASTVFGQVLQRGLMRIASPLAGVAEGFVNILQAVKTGEFKGLSKTGVAIAMGMRDAFDAIREGIGFVIDAVRGARTWFIETFGAGSLRSIAKFATIIAVAAAAFAPIAVALAGIGFVLPAIVTTLIGLGSVVAGVFGLILGPIGFVIAGVILFRNELFQIFSGMMEVAGPVFEDLKGIFMNAVDAIMIAFQEVSALFGSVTDGMTTDWKEVGRVIGAVLGTIITGLAKLAVFGIKVGAWLVGAFTKFSVFLGTLAGAIVEMVMHPLQSIAKGIIGFMELSGMEVPFSLRAYAGGGAAPRQAGRGVGGEQARGITDRLAQFGRDEATAAAEDKVAGEESRGALSGVLDEVAAAAAAAADSAKSAADSAKKKPQVAVNLDGREVARSSKKAEEEIEERSGFQATPWQRRMVAEHGAKPVT